MIDEIKAAFSDYMAGLEDKSGTSKLDVLIATLRLDNQIDKALLVDVLLQLLGGLDTARPKFWEAFALFTKELDCRSSDLAAACERSLKDGTGVTDQFFALRAMTYCGFDLTPKFLQSCLSLKNESPSLWLDLAITAYRGDVAGLVAAITELVRRAVRPLAWIDLRKRLPRLRESFRDDFNYAVKQIAGAIPYGDDRKSWLAAIDQRYGSRLSEAGLSPKRLSGDEELSTRIKAWTTPRIRPVVQRVGQFQESARAFSA